MKMTRAFAASLRQDSSSLGGMSPASALRGSATSKLTVALVVLLATVAALAGPCHATDQPDTTAVEPDQSTVSDEGLHGESHLPILDVDAAVEPFTIRPGAPDASILVDADGRLGLGTSAPASRLHAVHGSTPSIRLEQNDSLGHTPQTWEISASDTGFAVSDISAGPSQPLKVQAGAPSSSLEVSASGFVGIGTATPEARLHIVGTSPDLLKLESNGNVKLILEDTGGTPDDHQWAITNATTLRFAADDSPTAQMALDVNGNLVIQGALTSSASTSPDLVLAPGYSLRSLEHLELFIAEQGHLPDVPSASDTADGRQINISELQVRLLQKIEELTLYLLEQHHTIQQQQETIDRLDQEVDALRATLDAHQPPEH